MLQGAIVALMVGLLTGRAAKGCGIPGLLGMLLAGVLLGPYGLGWMDPQLLELSGDIRMLALTIILLRAGLGLDKQKILGQGSTALLLGIIPCTMEAAVLAVTAHYTLGWSWVVAWLFGWVICAESPAVLVPMMLRLKSQGWGAKSGLPDLVLAGGALSDVVAITVFGIVLNMASGPTNLGLAAVGAIPLRVAAGLLVGFLAGRLLVGLLARTELVEGSTQAAVLTLGGVVAIVLLGDRLGYSGYLAAMTAGFAIIDTDEVLARRIRGELERVWVVAEVFLFVLIGAEVNIPMVAEAGSIGVLLLAMGLFLGRLPGILLATAGSTLSTKEKLFMGVGYLAKATVQAAIGAIPLSMGIPNGELILAFAVLAIVITAPLGAVGTSLLAPLLLERGEVDPTRVTVETKYRFLVALDPRGAALRALEEAARLARQTDATLLIVHADQNGQTARMVTALYDSIRHLISDIEHDLIIVDGVPADSIIELAAASAVDVVFMGKSKTEMASPSMDGVTPKVLELSTVPVVVVEAV